jgi:hypothetical protein
MISRKLAIFDVIIGIPEAIASRITMPNASYLDARVAIHRNISRPSEQRYYEITKEISRCGATTLLLMDSTMVQYLCL